MTRLPAPVQDAVDKLTADGILLDVRAKDGDDTVLYAHVHRTPYDPGRTRATVLCALLPHAATVYVN